MDIDEINEHIRKLKREETSWQSVNKLAALCTVRNELNDDSQETGQTAAGKPAIVEPESRPIAAYSADLEPQSEFVESASAVPFSGLMRVLDEHMTAIKLAYPKEYELVMRKINALEN